MQNSTVSGNESKLTLAVLEEIHRKLCESSAFRALPLPFVEISNHEQEIARHMQVKKTKALFGESHNGSDNYYLPINLWDTTE